MPLILAIEPDRRQANQVNAVVRGRLKADLVLADSAERALAALGNRVPDLILTSAFLSPTDETKLGEHLRALDGAAAHIQTLTIPVLASSRSGSDSEIGGMLGGVLRRGKAKAAATPEGCDPAVFADQCAEYLERAEAERQNDAATHVEEPVAASKPAHESSAAKRPAPIEEPPPAPAPAAPPVETASTDKRHSKSKKKPEPSEPLVINAPAAEATVQEAIARLAAFAHIDDEPVAEEAIVEDAVAQEPVVEAAVASEPTVEAPVETAAPEFELSETFEPPDSSRQPPAAQLPIVEEPDVYDISGFDAEAFAVAVQSTSADTHVKSTGATKRDAPKPPAAATPAPLAQPRVRHDASDKRIAASRPKPVQDEWGFFDPEQAGFAALLAKLDEIEDDDPPRPARTPAAKKR